MKRNREGEMRRNIERGGGRGRERLRRERLRRKIGRGELRREIKGVKEG